MEFVFYLATCVFLLKKDLPFLPSTDSGFSALINARLALGCWSHIDLFIWGFTSLSTLYRSYQDG